MVVFRILGVENMEALLSYAHAPGMPDMKGHDGMTRDRSGLECSPRIGQLNGHVHPD